MFNNLEFKYKAGSELTLSELDFLKDFIKTCAPTLQLVKRGEVKNVTAKHELGIIMNKPTNPVTGKEYGHDTGHDLQIITKAKGWCNQYAGRSQWVSVGRNVPDGTEPAHKFLSMYKKMINLYSYEQTVGA